MLSQHLVLLGLLSAVGCQSSDVYWGSYELTIPGGSGAGNAVQHLNLPENAPEFFQFSALKTGPPAAPTFPPQTAPLQVIPQPPVQPQQLEVLTNDQPQQEERFLT